MNLQQLRQLEPCLWTLPRATGEKRAEVLLYGTAPLLVSMDDKVLEQAANVAFLPGVVGASMTMPDAQDVDLVAEATEQAGLARRVAFLRQEVCVKG